MADAPEPGHGWRIDEAARAAEVAAFERLAVRDSAPLQRIARFAAQLCDAPVALVTLVGETEQVFLARTGTEAEGTPRAISFCQHTIAGRDLLVLPDLAADPRFADNPLVTGGPQVRFYAGVPLVTDTGTALGSLCVLDVAPRPAGLTPLQQEGLAVLAADTMARLLDSRDAAAWRDSEEDRERRLVDSETRFRTLADTMPQMVWSTLPDGFHDYYNARWYEFTGVPQGSTDGEAWNDMFHPDDQARAWERWRHSLTTGDPYQIEYRLKHFDGTYRWVLGRALPIRDDDGAITRWFGTCTDIHEQKLAMEEREVITQELSHRIKNIFAVIAGLIGFAARSRPEFAPISNDLRQRITALGRAHDFVRPHSLNSRPSAQQDSLHGLLGDLFAPYQRAGADRVRVRGEDIAIDDRSATPLALLFHELATNATKYGALSVDDGVVTVEITLGGDDVTLRWSEHGGPAVTRPADDGKGFGSQLVELAAVRQLGGTVSRDWHVEGLGVAITVPRAAFSRIKA